MRTFTYDQLLRIHVSYAQDQWPVKTPFMLHWQSVVVHKQLEEGGPFMFAYFMIEHPDQLTPTVHEAKFITRDDRLLI